MIRLRKITNEDYVNIPLYLERLGYENIHEESIVNELLDNINMRCHDFFLVFEELSDEVVGAVYSYNYMIYDLNCYMKIQVFPQYIELSEKIINLFKDYLFDEYPLKHVYYKCTNTDAEYDSIEKAGFVKTAVLSNYKYIFGEYVDEVIYLINNGIENKYGAEEDRDEYLKMSYSV